MLLVQNFLTNHSLEELEQQHGVKAKIHGHKMSLNYSQIESVDTDLLAQECRGLILRQEPVTDLISSSAVIGSTQVVARGMDRFFNLGQGAAAAVDLEAKATTFAEKLDGTCCLVYFDDVVNEWHVATRSVSEANLPIDGFEDCTFRTLFEKSLEETCGKDFSTWTSTNLFRDTTYVFELTTPRNRIVVDYSDYRVTLIAARKTSSGKELDPIFVQAQVKISAATRYHLNSLDELVKFVKGRDPTKFEGVVVCDKGFQRIKVKNIGYFALSRVKNLATKSPRGIVELILLEKLDDALPLLPDALITKALLLKQAFKDLLSKHREDYKRISTEASESVSERNISKKDPSFQRELRKTFAIMVNENDGWLSPMMDQFQGKSSDLLEWINNRNGIKGNASWSNSFLDSLLEKLTNYV